MPHVSFSCTFGHHLLSLDPAGLCLCCKVRARPVHASPQPSAVCGPAFASSQLSCVCDPSSPPPSTRLCVTQPSLPHPALHCVCVTWLCLLPLSLCLDWLLLLMHFRAWPCHLHSSTHLIVCDVATPPPPLILLIVRDPAAPPFRVLCWQQASGEASASSSARTRMGAGEPHTAHTHSTQKLLSPHSDFVCYYGLFCMLLWTLSLHVHGCVCYPYRWK